MASVQRMEVLVKMKKERKVREEGGGVRGMCTKNGSYCEKEKKKKKSRDGGRGQGGCERRIEVFCENSRQKKRGRAGVRSEIGVGEGGSKV